MAVRQLSLSSSDDTGGSWLDSLPKTRLFSHLRDQGGGDRDCRGNVVCTIGENLFVWSQNEHAVLTLNLKRLSAQPQDDIFQKLVCTLPRPDPDGADTLLGLIPEGNGHYLALHYRRGLVILKLHYHRGKFGEFAGGREEVFCKTLEVSRDIFVVNEHLTLVQVSWHPDPRFRDTLALLTSDNSLRLFNLADPELPFLELSLLSPSSIHLYPNTIKLEEYSIVSFALWSPSDQAFVFHESGDVSLVSLTQHSRPHKLSMHPQDTAGNYISSACSMLLLETSPLGLVLAGRSGMEDMMVCHCIYLESSEDDSPGPRDAQRLYVVESINIQCRDQERGGSSVSEQADGDSERVDSDFTLLRDPANPYGYFVKHPEGVHAVHLPWLRKLETFTSTNMSTLISEAQCQVNYLMSTIPDYTSLQGLSVLWEPRLGYALIGLTLKDLECVTLGLTEPEDQDGVGHDFVDWVPQRRLQAPEPPTTSNFVKSIQEILHPAGDDHSLPLRRHRGSKLSESDSQAECLQFLMKSVKQLRMTYIIRQQLALQKIRERIETSNQLKHKIISDLAMLSDECDIIEEESEKLQGKLKTLSDKNAALLQQVRRLACCATSRPPILSEAEECMMREIEGLDNHMKLMNAEIHSNKGKLKLCREMDATPEMDLSATQSSSLLKKLVDNGEKIKALHSLVKALGEVVSSVY